ADVSVGVGPARVGRCFFHPHGLPGSLLVLPVLLALQFILVVGLMSPIAVLSVLFRDVQHALPLLILALFYASPVFYSADLVPESVRGLYMLNPFAGLLSLYHAVLFEEIGRAHV